MPRWFPFANLQFAMQALRETIQKEYREILERRVYTGLQPYPFLFS